MHKTTRRTSLLNSGAFLSTSAGNAPFIAEGTTGNVLTLTTNLADPVFSEFTDVGSITISAAGIVAIQSVIAPGATRIANARVTGTFDGATYRIDKSFTLTGQGVPVFNALTVGTTAYQDNTQPGAEVAAISGRTTGSTITITNGGSAPNNPVATGKLAVSSSTAKLLAGVSAPLTAGGSTGTYFLTESKLGYADRTSGPFDSITVAASVINNAPAWTSASSISVAENTASTIYTCAATDANGDSLTFSKVGGADAALFTLTGAALRFTGAPNFESPTDANGDNVYEVTLGVSDGIAAIVNRTLSVTVTNVLEVTLSGVTVTPATLSPGPQAPGTVLATVSGRVSGDSLALTGTLAAAGAVFNGGMTQILVGASALSSGTYGYTVTQSHGDASGTAATSGSVVVAPPLPSVSASTQSAIFGTRNGLTTASGVARRFYQMPSALANVFGPTGTRQPHLLAIRGRLALDGVTQSYNNTNATAEQALFASNTATQSNSIKVSFQPTNSGSAGFKRRFVLQGALNGVTYGDRDPTTGATGSVSTARGLRSAEIDVLGPLDFTLFIRMNAAGRLQMYHSINGGALVAGDFFDQGSTFGRTALAAVATIGGITGQPASGETISPHWQGALADFIQVSNRDVTDAEMLAFAQGASPSTLFSSALTVHYDLNSTARTAGSGYGNLVETGTVIKRGPALRPGYAASGRTIALRSEGNGYVHALRMADVRDAANATALRALTAPMLFRFTLAGGGTTHVQARIVKISDGTVVRDWTRITGSPIGDGTYALDLPECPVGRGYAREIWREDEPAVVIRDSDDHRVGPVFGVAGQSQLQRLLGATTLVEAWPSMPDATTLIGLVSVISSHYARLNIDPLPFGCTVINRNDYFAPSMTALAQEWERVAADVPLGLCFFNMSGRGMADSGTAGFMTNPVSGSWNLFGNGTDPATGYLTAAVDRVNRRMTGVLFNWITADQTVVWSAGTGAATTNKYFAGVGASGSDYHFGLLGLRDPVWLVAVPGTRHRNTAAFDAMTATVQTVSNGWHAARNAQRAYFGGTGVSGSLSVMIGAHCHDMHMADQTETAHQSPTEVEGVARFARRNATALLRACKLAVVNVESGVSAVVRSGAVITVSFSLQNGGSLATASGGVPAGFEVSEDGGTTWVRNTYVAALSGNTVTLTRTSGNWAANTQVRYCHGFPWAVGVGNTAQSIIDELAGIRNFLFESGVAAHEGGMVPIVPTVSPLVAA